MTARGFSQILRGAGGALELNRFNLFIGAIGFVLSTIGFQAWAMARGEHFDVSDYCTAFGLGFAGLGLGGAGAVALKDRQVAMARTIEQTGRVPAPPPAGPPVPAGKAPPLDDPDAAAS